MPTNVDYVRIKMCILWIIRHTQPDKNLARGRLPSVDWWYVSRAGSSIPWRTRCSGRNGLCLCRRLAVLWELAAPSKQSGVFVPRSHHSLYCCAAFQCKQQTRCNVLVVCGAFSPRNRPLMQRLAFICATSYSCYNVVYNAKRLIPTVVNRRMTQSCASQFRMCRLGCRQRAVCPTCFMRANLR